MWGIWGSIKTGRGCGGGPGGNYRGVSSKAAEGGEVMVMCRCLCLPVCICICISPYLSARVSLSRCLSLSLCQCASVCCMSVSVSMCQIMPTVKKKPPIDRFIYTTPCNINPIESSSSLPDQYRETPGRKGRYIGAFAFFC